MLTRRQVLQRLLSMPALSGFLGGSFLGSVVGAPASEALAAPPARDYFHELGIRTFINASGTYTSLTGSLLPEEVVEAIAYASQRYVALDEIQDKVGERIASLLGCEYATVTSGAFSAMTLGTAGVMCGMDEEKVVRLPDTSGMKSEILMPRPPGYVGYVHALTNTGAKVFEVETLDEMERRIDGKTAMLFMLNAYNDTEISHVDLVALGKKHGIPTMNDCAADVPPVENLWKYTDMGYDLVCFSGGKALRGPQSAGLLLGRKDLILAARLHAPPRGATIGRGMKVNKEEVLAMYVALERFVSLDHDALWAQWEAQTNHIRDAAESVPGTETEYHVPDVANHTPSLRITWDEQRIPITGGEVAENMRSGHPSIEILGGDDGLSLTVWMMRPGEEREVARRIKEELTRASEGVKGEE